MYIPAGHCAETIAKKAKLHYGESKSDSGETGLTDSFIWKSIIALVIAVLVLSYYLAG